MTAPTTADAKTFTTTDFRLRSGVFMPKVTIAYGMTETSPVSFQSGADDSLEVRVSTVGHIHPHLEVKVIDDGKGLKSLPKKPDIERKMHGEEDPRGMGMFLIQALVDEAEWVSAPPSGSYARLVIHLHKTE